MPTIFFSSSLSSFLSSFFRLRLGFETGRVICRGEMDGPGMDGGFIFSSFLLSFWIYICVEKICGGSRSRGVQHYSQECKSARV